MSTEGKRIWKLDVGPHWDELLAQSEMAIGTDDTVNLTNLSRDQIRAEVAPDLHAARELNDFRHEVNPGDVVVAYDQGQIVGIGQVAFEPEGKYQFAPAAPQGVHQRKVIWQVISAGIPIPDPLLRAHWLSTDTPDFVPVTDPDSVEWILRLQ